MNGKKICTVLINIYLSFYVYEICYYIFHVLTIYKSKNWYKKVHTCINVRVMYHQFISCNLFWNTELHVLVHYKLDVCVQCSVKITKHLTLISLTLYLHIIRPNYCPPNAIEFIRCNLALSSNVTMLKSWIFILNQSRTQAI